MSVPRSSIGLILSTILIIISRVSCVVVSNGTRNEIDGKNNETDRFVFDGIVSAVKQCMRHAEKIDCFKRKAIERLNEELRSNETVIEITDMISIRKDPEWIAAGDQSSRTSRALESASGDELTAMLYQKIEEYLKSILIQFSLKPEKSEARKKGDKGGSMYMYGALGMASMLGQLFMGKMAMVSGMALLMSKVALMLTIMKMVGGGGGGGGSEHIVYQESHGGGGGGGGWKRSSVNNNGGYTAYGRKIEVPSQLDSPYYYDGKNNVK